MLTLDDANDDELSAEIPCLPTHAAAEEVIWELSSQEEENAPLMSLRRHFNLWKRLKLKRDFAHASLSYDTEETKLGGA